MKVLIAPDSFKGSLTSVQVAGCIEKGILRVYPGAEVEKVPVADGGEGTVECIVAALGGTYRTVEVHGPLGEKVSARYGITGEGTAVIEMAEASGLTLVPEGKRNPMLATSFGFGELIRDALAQGCRKLILGIGGSATNDCGTGMAAALGVRFLDGDGNRVEGNGGSLYRIAGIHMEGLIPGIGDAELIAASDVTNPLCGEKGASRVYGPQKGATPEMVDILDGNLEYMAALIKRQLGVDIREVPGAGAAGGVGGGLLAFCGARLERGIEYILDLVEMDRRVQEADVVITGEGRMDGQTVFGKVPVGVAKRAKRYGKPVFAICGAIGEGMEEVYKHGIDAVVSTVAAPLTLEEAMGNGARNLEDAAERLFRIIRAARVWA